jgi:predicted nucleotidyltransferase
MRVRPRDFIYTIDDLFFASTNYLHPEDRIISFLRYIHNTKGERSKNNARYSKVDTKQAFEFLSQNYPDYLFDCDITNTPMMGVPLEKVLEILHPDNRLKDILNTHPPDDLIKKVIILANTFHDFAEIPYEKMGVSGSILPNLYDPKQSDIDFVIYGLKNHQKAMNTFKELKVMKNSILKGIEEEYWAKLYEKRIKDASIGYDEFKWYENRKNNRGIINGTLFDILATRDWNEIKGTYGEKTFQNLGKGKIECTVSDAIASFDNPAIYTVEDVKIIEGPHVPINELASFTHTYAGQVKEGEKIIAKGKIEKVINKKTRETNYRLIIGTTRESIDEYIKLKNLRL